MVLALLMLGGALDPVSLVGQLADDSIEVREAAVAHLKAMGPTAFAALEDGLAHSDPEVRSRSLEVLVAEFPELPGDLVSRRPELRWEKVVREAMPHVKNLSGRVIWVLDNREAMLERNEDLRALKAIGPAVVPLILSELNGPARFTMTVALG